MTNVETVNKLLLDACKEFIRKVDVGEARSVKSYNQMKEAVEAAEKLT